MYIITLFYICQRAIYIYTWSQAHLLFGRKRLRPRRREKNSLGDLHTWPFLLITILFILRFYCHCLLAFDQNATLRYELKT